MIRFWTSTSEEGTVLLELASRSLESLSKWIRRSGALKGIRLILCLKSRLTRLHSPELAGETPHSYFRVLQLQAEKADWMDE